MFFYKLRKLFKLKKRKLILGSSGMSLIASLASPFFLFFLFNGEFSNSNKRPMFFTSIIFSSLNLLTIYLVSNYLYLNEIFCIFISFLINFLIYLIPAFLLSIYFEWSDVIVTQDEIRDYKLNRLLRKLF